MGEPSLMQSVKVNSEYHLQSKVQECESVKTMKSLLAC